MDYLLLAILIVYLITSIRTQLWLNQVKVLSPSQKRIHTLLIWLLPLIWVRLIRRIVEPVKGSWQYDRKREDNGSIKNASGLGTGANSG
jgi:hypothetical protein